MRRTAPDGSSSHQRLVACAALIESPEGRAANGAIGPTVGRDIWSAEGALFEAETTRDRAGPALEGTA